MNDDASRCPSPEVLAAFVAGRLSGDELRMTADHLLDCEDCRFIVREAADVERAERSETPVPRRRAAPWWLAAAAAAIACVAWLAWRSPESARQDGISRLVDAIPAGSRYLEPRLTGGFPWAPLRPAFRSGERELDAGQMKLIGAAGEVLERAEGDPSPEAKHAAAVAHLLAGRPAEAATRLAAVAESNGGARVWSDLAAARYQSALLTADASQFAEALAAADAALRFDPDSAEALFNRALIVEHLGLRDQARAAWERFLSVEPSGPWADEAREHLRVLGPVTEFREELERGYTSLLDDPEAARALARRFPQEARVWGESEILCRWARAHQAADAERAAAHLRVAEAFGAETAARDGDRMLAEAVAAVQRSGGPARDALATAHLALREAQRAYKAGKPGDAERAFTSAATGFEKAGSPAVFVAAGLAANTIYDQGRITESRARLEALLRDTPPRFAAVRAQMEWQLGLAYGSTGRWGDAIRSLKGSVASFERLHERNHATSVREILAQVYDQIGDTQTAWTHRMIALQELGRTESRRLKIAIDAAARAAAAARKWPVALSFLGLQLELTRDSGEEFHAVQTLLLRARIAGLTEQPAAARADLHRASVELQRVIDPALRERAEADRVAIEGLLARSAAEAVPLLTRAIDFHHERGRRMFLPDLYLHRGRALERLGDGHAAAADYERGIAELEAQRSSIQEGDERWGMFAGADELFEEALVLAHRRGDPASAFAYAERARARALLESIGDTRSAAPAASGADDAVVIEYVSLPDRLLIFVAAGGAVRVVETHVSRGELAAQAEQLTRSASADDRERFRRSAAALHARLVAPVARELSSFATVVFVPDATLGSVPFAALIDASGRYVVESHAVVVAPSAAVFARLCAQPRRDRRDPHLLVVAGPSSPDGRLPPLTATAGESAAVAGVYREAVSLRRGAGNPVTFAARAASADVIHFAGHADGGEAGEAALFTAHGADGDDRLDVREIAAMRLSRTRTVVLAACSTARGRQRAGEGTISVARAFLAAGVPSVVATLWPIEDSSAAEFFPRLHQHLARGVAPAEALRAAQLEWIHRDDAPPRMWAAVQIIGS